MAITKDQVFEVAEKLLQRGEQPTISAVRKELGTGSYSTLTDFMRQWRDSVEQSAAPIREPLPQVVQDRLDILGTDIWSVALELANTRLKSERESLEFARIELEQQQQETAQLADDLAAEVEVLKDINNANILSLDAAATEIQSLTDKNDLLETQAEVRDVKIQDLKLALSQEQQSSAGWQQRYDDQLAKYDLLASDREQLSISLAKASSVLDSERQSHQLQIDGLKQSHQFEVEILKDTINGLEEQLKQYAADLQEIRIDRDTVFGDFKTLQGEIKAYRDLTKKDQVKKTGGDTPKGQG
ncbi:Chromosome partition protein Smc [compost metagenome]